MTIKTTKKPEYMSAGAMCFDISADKDAVWEHKLIANDIYINTVVIDTGMFVEIPEGYGMNVFIRSGWAFKYNIQLVNGTGKIDADYRGEIKIKLIQIGEKDSLPDIKKGTRVAQGEIVKVLLYDFEINNQLSETERGTNGFGSTGA
jgi:dUTP pyrophosphatase